MTIHTVATFPDVETAHEALVHLEEQGFRKRRVGLLMGPAAASVVDDAETETPAGAPSSRMKLSVALGSLLGGLTGFGIAGPAGLAAGGAMAVVAATTLVGGAVGGVAGLLGGLGIPRSKAEDLRDRIAGGEVLVTVTSTEPTRASVAEHTLRQHTNDSPVGTYASRDAQ